MSNPARYLHEFLSRSIDEQHGHPFPPLFAATVDMQEQLGVLGDAGYDVDAFDDLTDSIRVALRDRASQDLSFIVTQRPQKSGRCAITKPELSLLKLASARLEVRDQIDAEGIKNIEELLTWVTQAVREDFNLDPHLALFITQTISAIKAELADFSVTREFALRDAIIRLFGLIRAAEASSTEPSRWKEGWDKWGVPIAQGLIVSLPQLAIAAPMLLKSISS